MLSWYKGVMANWGTFTVAVMVSEGKDDRLIGVWFH